MGVARLLERAGISLIKKGFTVKALTRSCFDLIARKGGRILLVKTLSDANAINEEHARQMQNISSYMGASPLIIAEKAGHELQDNVVYSRLGVYALNFSTFASCMDEKLPFVASTNAGLTASIISGRLRKKREEAGLSLAQLSSRIGVSRRMVTKYESDGSASITIAKAEKLYDVLGHEVFDKIDVFSRRFSEPGIMQTPITMKYSELGFEASGARKVPFDVIARKDEELILTEVRDRTDPDLTSLSRLLDADNLVIFSRKKPKDRDIPAIAKDEFMDFAEADELIRFVREY